MLRWQIRILRISYMVLDFMALAISVPITISLAYRLNIQLESLQSPMEIYTFITVIYLCYISVFMLVELYGSFMRSQSPITAKLALKTILAFIPGHFISFIVFSIFFHGYTYLFHLLHTTLFFLISMLARMLYFIMRRKDDHNVSKQRNVLLVGQSSNGRRYYETIQRYTYLHYNIIGFIHIKHIPIGCTSGLNVTSEEKVFSEGNIKNSDGNGEAFKPCNPHDSIYEDLRHLGGLENIESIVNNQVVDELVVTRPLSYDKRLGNTLLGMQKRGITITMLLNRTNINTANATVSMIEDIPALKFHTVSLHEGQLMAKRILDITGALVGMIIFGIAWLIFAPLIKLESKSPVIFKQDRVGKNGRVFKIWKFRSMVDGADSMKKALERKNEMEGHMFKMAKDPRVTRVGRIMRKTNIDELPQFFNVLIGDMSLVGTRPPTVDEVKEYQTHHYKRISVIPGITGMWQVSGGNKVTDFEEVVRLDDEYIKDWSIWKDVKIIAKTLILTWKLLANAVKFSPVKKKQEIAAYENRDG